jgi:hypothetical protein
VKQIRGHYVALKNRKPTENPLQAEIKMNNKVYYAMFWGWVMIFVCHIAEVKAETGQNEGLISLEQYISETSSASSPSGSTRYAQNSPNPPASSPYSSTYRAPQLPEICTCNDPQNIGRSQIWHCYCGNLDCVIVTSLKEKGDISCVYRK